jgi:hypothetical protein
MSEDLLGFAGGYNFYAYVANKPTEFGDPMGLLPTNNHYNLTLDLARAAFGQKCLSRAQNIAQANANQDALPGLAAKLKFIVGVGEGWRKGGIHFGGPVDQLLRNAFSSCDDNSLGKALHGLQDDLSHNGAYANPWVHYSTSVLSYITLGIGGGFNPADQPSLQSSNDIAGDTALILQQYSRNCLKCCQ